jgi:hypothetical protein
MKSVTPTIHGPPFDGFSIALSLLTVCILKNINLEADECTVYKTPCTSELNLPLLLLLSSLTLRP